MVRHVGCYLLVGRAECDLRQRALLIVSLVFLSMRTLAALPMLAPDLHLLQVLRCLVKLFKERFLDLRRLSLGAFAARLPLRLVPIRLLVALVPLFVAQVGHHFALSAVVVILFNLIGVSEFPAVLQQLACFT